MEEFSLTNDEKITLLKIARSTLENYLKNGRKTEISVNSETLKTKRGAFVTLNKRGNLRGCIGRIVADTPLYKTIAEYAIHAAVDDPRFPPVKYDELEDIEIEISVLTPFTEVKSLDEIEVGKHGLMIRKGFRSGLLLPQVPVEWGWDRETFLKQTCVKAGLPPDSYKDGDASLFRFSAIVFSESDFKGSD
jgi:AmmeMemoRadiSam system protein A